ncbi:hypothetical protein E2C01_033904 [Portunus trituberculatus]|uniref:Uncharacterized protein n=1 Tax=Portunus trituberculatus TaxID=210409 RepID=A0A5B7F5C2_PORTR|nr:hypothetical protein [Portunus trituberculatus]
MSTITVSGVEEKLPVFVADMEEPCLLGLDFLVQSEACVDIGRMWMQVRGHWVPLILEDAVEQVESPVTSSDVENKRLELLCRVVRESETADVTVIARERQVAERSCGGEVDGDAEGQLWRWLSYMEEYNYRMVHRPGCNHVNADSLSRRPCEVGCSHCS